MAQTGAGSFLKVARWFVLLALIAGIFLALQDPPRPELPDPRMFQEDVASFEGKLGNMELARRRGECLETHFSADEINAAMNSPELAQMADARQRIHAPSGLQGSGTPDEVLFDFSGDQAIGYFTANVLGRDLHVQLSAKPGTSQGYITLDPTGFRVGSLPLPVFVARPVLQRALEAPAARAKLQLPDFVQDVRVQNGELIVTGGQ